MRAVLAGLGAVGTRTARQLLSSKSINHLTVLVRRPAQAPNLAGPITVEELCPANAAASVRGASAAVLATPVAHRLLAGLCLDAGVPVVSVSDDMDEVRSLLELDDRARNQGLPVVVGAAMAPGLSCLLAAWVASRFDQLAELHIATLGTGGPACARSRHASLRETVEEWRDGTWARKVASSGRELVWFPGQVGGADCYRVNRPDPLLLVRALPGLQAATTRAAASRRDRMTTWLPMLRPPHPEGTVGAVRVEARGYRSGTAKSVVVGAVGRPALLAGAVAAACAVRAASGQLLPGAGGLASLVPDPGAMLAELRERGTQVMVFQGEPVTPAW